MAHAALSVIEMIARSARDLSWRCDLVEREKECLALRAACLVHVEGNVSHVPSKNK